MKHIFLMLVLALTLFLSGCGNSVQETKDSSSVPAVSDSEGNNSSLKSTTELSIGTTYTIQDLCEFKVNNVALCKEVIPPHPGNFYTYYEENDGSTYVDISVNMENLRETARTADEFGYAKIICDGKYEYNS